MDPLTDFFLKLLLHKKKKPCTSHRIRKECIKGAETLAKSPTLQNGHIQKQNAEDTITKMRFRTNNFPIISSWKLEGE